MSTAVWVGHGPLKKGCLKVDTENGPEFIQPGQEFDTGVLDKDHLAELVSKKLVKKGKVQKPAADKPKGDKK